MTIPTPPDLAEGRVTWTIGRGSSRALAAGRGVVRFRASAVAVNFSTASVLPDPVEAPVLAGVMTPVDLIQNDPEIWNWVVEPLLGVPWEPFPIDVDGPVNLATAAVAPGKGPVRAVKGAPGPGLTGQVRYDGGQIEFEIEGGTYTDPVEMPPGPPGPANTLTIGQVTTGEPGGAAAASITGTAPAQVLSLTLPRGEAPATSWQGTRLVVDGTVGPDLQGIPGADSTEPGPPGKSAYEYAVQAGFEGTEEEFATAILPDTVTWENVDGKPTTFPPTIGSTATTAAAGNHVHAWGAITGKPTSFPPATHTHPASDITGLADAVAPGPWVQLTLLGDWVAYTGGGGYFPGVRARLVAGGVQIQGMVRSGAAGSSIAQLPADMQPAYAQMFTVALNQNELGTCSVSPASDMGGQYGVRYNYGKATPGYCAISATIPLG